jgi:hypothetical protein
MRSLSELGCLTVLILPITAGACGADDHSGGSGPGGSSAGGSPEGGGTAGSSGNAGGGADGVGGGTDGGGIADADAAPPPTCELRTEDHSAACPSSCAIETDVSVACSEDDFGTYGLRVAAGPDTTYLAGMGRVLQWVGRVNASSVERWMFPESWATSRLELALSPSGEPLVAGSGALGLVWATRTTDGFTTERVFPSEDGTGRHPYDLNVDALGVAYLWMDSRYTGAIYAMGRRDPAGGWNFQDVPPFVPEQDRRFALSQDAKSVAYHIVLDENGPAGVRVHYDGRDRLFEGGKTGFIPVPHQPDAHGPVHAMVTQDPEYLSAVWPTPEGFAADRLPDTTVWRQSCRAVAPPVGGGPPSCEPGTCHDDSRGVVPDAYAVDRASDGTLWIAYVYRYRDRDMSYSYVPPNPNLPIGQCNETVIRDNSRHELHLVRIAQGMAPTRVFTIPLADFKPNFWDFGLGARPVDLHIRRDALAIGVMSGSRMRVLRLNISAMSGR